MKTIIFTIFLATPILLSCSSTKSSGQSEQKLAKAIKFTEKKEGTGLVTITKANGLSGLVCAVGIYIDGEFVGELKGSEKISLYIPRGRRSIGIGPTEDAGMVCSMMSSINKEATVRDVPKSFKIVGTDSGSTDLIAY